MPTTKTRVPRDTNTKVEAAKRFLAEGLSQQEAAKKVGVSGWTISQWKAKGKLGALPKGRIPKAKAAKTLPKVTATVKPAETPKASVATLEELQAENEALRYALREIKALVPPAILAAYKKAAASVLATLE